MGHLLTIEVTYKSEPLILGAVGDFVFLCNDKSKGYTPADLITHNEWIWLEVGVSATSVLTGEIILISDLQIVHKSKK